MRKRIIFILALVLCAVAARAQFTTVSGTILDPNGLPYAQGTIAPVLITNGGAAPTLNGQPYSPPTQPVGIDNSGVFLMRLADTSVLQPSGLKWNFNVCSAVGTVPPALGFGSRCFSLASPISITGSSVDISTNLQAVALALTRLFTSGGGIAGTVSSPFIPYASGPNTLANSGCTWGASTQTCPAFALSGTPPMYFATQYGNTPTASTGVGFTNLAPDPLTGQWGQSIDGGAYAAFLTGTLPVPGGAVNSVQTNVPSGTFGGFSGFTWDGTTIGLPDLTSAITASLTTLNMPVTFVNTFKTAILNSTSSSLAIDMTSGRGFQILETAAPVNAPFASYDFIWADATAHRWSMSNNNAAALMIPGIATAGTSGNCVKLATNGIDLVDNGSACAAGGGGALSAITGAIGANTIANGNNGLQIWNWAATTNQNQFQFGETTAATNGTLGNQYILSAKTLAGSTAVPLGIINSLTGSQTLPSLHITPTWNTSGVVDAALLINVTNTASGPGSLLADWQIGGTSQFKVDKAGNETLLASLFTGTSPPSACGGTAGCWAAGEGTAPTAAANVDELAANSTLHDFAITPNNATAPGIVEHAAPGAITSTTNTSAIATATLCASAAGACNQAGRYRVDWNFVEGGTACGTPGTGGVTFLLTWTDSIGTAHSAVSLPMDDSASLTATSGTFTFRTTLAAAWAHGSFNVDSNGSIIQYATGYTACSVGTGNYTLNATVTRIG